MNALCATIDFESRSACSLRKSGSWRYSIDPTTEILCLCFRLHHWLPGRTALWTPDFPHLGIDGVFPSADIIELIQWIEGGGLVEAHNASFERCIWANQLVPKFGWPSLAIAQIRCSAAKAATHALPRGLEDVGMALGLKEQKDSVGHKLMLKLSKPRKSRKKERETWQRTGTPPPSLLWHESKDYFERLWDYCKTDVLVESELSKALPDLNPHETLIYTMDQTINQRGFQLDLTAVNTALGLIASETKKLNKELAKLTNGKVPRATCRAQMIAWLSEEGLQISDTQKETIDAYLAPECRELLTIPARRALEIMRALGRSSTAKYQAMQNWAGSDGRVRGGLLYHGASTGRWSGSGVQPHNFVRGTVKDMDALWHTLKGNNRSQIENTYGGVMEALSNALRGAIVAGPGKTLYVADYAAIEARVVMWLAGEKEALEMFRKGEDIYLAMASSVYNIVCNKKDHPNERQLGKQIILGCGFQMGGPKFQGTCEKYGIIIEEDFAKEVVAAYRAKYPKVVNLWWATEDAAIRAVKSRKPVGCGKVVWFMEGKFLYCRLPSGRCLAYPFPKVGEKMTPWGEMRPQLTFMSINAYTRKWERGHTYGGSLVENGVQAIARDLLADALLRCEQSGVYLPVLSIHDESLCEADTTASNLQEFNRLMTAAPAWGKDIPIAIDSWKGQRYKKG